MLVDNNVSPTPVKSITLWLMTITTRCTVKKKNVKSIVIILIFRLGWLYTVKIFFLNWNITLTELLLMTFAYLSGFWRVLRNRWIFFPSQLWDCIFFFFVIYIRIFFINVATYYLCIHNKYYIIVIEIRNCFQTFRWESFLLIYHLFLRLL